MMEWICTITNKEDKWWQKQKLVKIEKEGEKKQKIIVKIVAWSEIKLTRKWNVNKKTETEM